MSSMVIAMVREVFFGPDGDDRLRTVLSEARQRGAELAVLPELALMPWRPASRTPVDSDAEPLRGATFERLSRAARYEAIGVLGGLIELDPQSGRRHGTAVLVDAYGQYVSHYRKTHVPQEEGFWEGDHYDAGDDVPQVIEGAPLRLGVQICSDVNRPQGTHLLSAQGAEVVLCPRATEEATFSRWRTVLTANALVSSCYVLSVPRPRPEAGVLLGGPSFAVAPDGTVLVETEDMLSYVEVERDAVEHARHAYPGYLAVRAPLYARGWADLGEQRRDWRR